MKRGVFDGEGWGKVGGDEVWELWVGLNKESC